MVQRLIESGAHHPCAGDDDVEPGQMRHLDQRGDSPAFPTDDACSCAAVFDFRGSVRAIAALVLEALNEKRIALAVRMRARHEEAREPGLGFRKGEEGIA